jgi:hypothetical protein
MDMEMTAPTAAATMATVVIERKYQSRMMASFALQLVLQLVSLQRIVLST